MEVKVIVGMLSAFEELFKEVEPALNRHFGEIDYRSGILPFTHTSYYEKEMGKNLLRRFISFSKLADAGSLPDMKKTTMSIEKDFSDKAGNRKINLDPGYFDGAKLVLATTKNYDHRIYLRDGIYAEVTLHFRDGSFRPWDWTYPDYRTQEYIEIFNGIRKIYLDQLRDSRRIT